MSDRAMSEAAMLSSLRDIRLPAEAAGGLGADVAVAVGLAALLALVIGGGLRALSLRRAAGGVVSGTDRLSELGDLPAAERRVALLHMVRAGAPERYREIRGAIYQPGGGVDLATLEAEVARLG